MCRLEDRWVPAPIPILHGLPGAPTAIYLDFDGEGSNSAYSEDGNFADWNASEVANITECWRQMSSYYSMFDVDVTTVKPAGGFPYAWMILSNSISGGYSFVGVFPNSSPQSFNQSSDVRTRVSGIAHEAGHNFGNSHQSDYNGLGVKTAEYSSGYDTLHGPLMGVDFAGTVHKWFVGHPSSSPSALQDDMAVIANRIRPYQPAGGDGYRADDFTNVIATATPLPVVGTNQTNSGIIERMADADAFTFTTASGRATLDLATPAPSGLDGKLEVFDAAGILLATADAATNDQHLTISLPAGTYYAVVSSHGNYGDSGKYNLNVRDVTPVPPPTYNSLPAPANLVLTHGVGTGVDLAWEAVSGATSGYSVQRSPDGGQWSPIATTADGVTTYSSTGLGGGVRWFYRVAAVDATGQSPPSTVASLVNRPSAPTNFSVSSWQTTSLILNWRDTTGETGYRIERSLDGGTTWSTLTSVGVNIPSYTNNGLTAATTYSYRVVPTSADGDGPASAVVNRSTRLPTVTGLAIGTATATAVPLTWNAVTGATGYRVERSLDGTTFSILANPTTNSYVNTSVSASREYYYRVTATNATSEGINSGSVRFVATPGSQPLPAPWQTQDIGAVAGAGAAGLNGTTFTVIGSGAGLSTTTDQFHFVHQPFNGDGEIIARITAIENTNAAARAGLMIRSALTNNSPFAFMGLTPTSGSSFQRRTTTGGTVASTNGAGLAPTWVRLVRAGDIFTAYTSTDGVAWTTISSTTVAMGTSVFAGLLVTAGSTTLLNTSTFTDFSLEDSTAATVTGVTIGDGTIQRSRVEQFQVSFSDVISYAGAPEAAFALERLVGGVPVETLSILVTTDTVGGVSVATIGLAGTTEFGSLADGRYRLTVYGNQIQNAGGVFIVGDTVTDFHRMYGDVNGDARVDIADFGVFSTAYLEPANYSAALDYNDDGVIDITEFGQFSLRYFTTLP